jgi:hypothetical protein
MINKLQRTIFPLFLASILIIAVYVANAQITNMAKIRNTGQISTTKIWAKSGYWRDIQTAVDTVSAIGGGIVYIPEGTWNFVNKGESWSGARVVIPAGVSIFGAPTERYENGSVKEWKTVLVMPWEVPTTGPDDNPTWFRFTVNANKPIRFSDIKLVGYRYFNTSSRTMYRGVEIWGPYENYPTTGCLDFRIDHCCFQDLAGSGVAISGESEHNRRVYRGIIDHNVFNNTYGQPGFGSSPGGYNNRTLNYGIMLRRWACDVWDYSLTNIHGKYTNYTVFIENNYFSKWRHCICSNDGFHVVARYNIVEGDYGYSFDGHGSYADDYRPYAVGTRAWEVYNNTFKNPDTRWTTQPVALNIRGGSWIVTNNTLIGYYALCDLNNDWGNYEPYCPQCHINQTYIWNNNLGGAQFVKYNSDNTLNVHYFLRAPNLTSDGFEYIPYVYPHPLTQGRES